MSREPLGLYIFRFLTGCGLLAFMAMIYWSTSLLESDVKSVQTELARLREEMNHLQGAADAIREDVLETKLDEKKNWQALLRSSIQGVDITPSGEAPLPLDVQPPLAPSKTQRPHIDPSLKNLLQENPFYSVTLPKLLPKNFVPRGTFQRASIAKPPNLHPLSGWSEISDWNSLCTVSVATTVFGQYEAMAPDMAIKLEERKRPGSDVSEFWVHLRDNVYWEPLEQKFFSDVKLAPHFLKRHQVSAEDFKLYYDAIMNPYVQESGGVALRTYYGDIVEIEVIDRLTFVVRWKATVVKDAEGKEVEKIKYIAKQLTGGLRPLASFVYKYFPDGSKILEEDSAPETYRTNSVWGQNFTQHWAKNIIPSCGAWAFDGMNDRQIRFRRNMNYYSPLEALAKAIVVTFKNSPDGVWTAFEGGELDTYVIQPDQLIELDEFLHTPQYQGQAERGCAIERIDYLSRSYSYIGWNQATPFFSRKKVRLAMTLAIDRRRIIQQNLNGMGVEITGTFFKNSSAYDSSITPWPFDQERAKRLLEEEGWYDSDGDGILEKVIDGKKVLFEFFLTYYVKNSTTKAICEYIATALKEIGVICKLNGVDTADLSAKFEEKSFDALALAWVYGAPPDDPKQIWHSSGAKQQGSSNAIGFANKEADAIIEELQYEYNAQKRIELYHRFDRIIHDEQPYTFLYTPKVAMLYRDYVQNVFIPSERRDIIPGAEVSEPVSSIFWLKNAACRSPDR